MRRIIRATLYHARKYDLGCPTEAKCSLFAQSGERACTTCPKHLKPAEATPPPSAGPRVAFLVKLESMIAVGCKFGPDDLPMRAWEELIWLRLERDRLDEIIRNRKDGKVDDLPPALQQQRNEVRKMDGIPPPGQSLFRGKR